jgi:Tol biopolymer transport system component
MKSILIAIIAASLAAAAQSEPARQLKAAENAELVDGDLKAAIKQYGAIIVKYKSDRAVVAMAMVRMAGCYQRMGDVEGRKIYERVVSDYADQKEAVAIARARLQEGKTTSASGIITRQVWTGPKVDTLGTVSPDGHWLSFVDWSTGDLALRDLITGEDRRLTNKGSWADSNEFAEESVISRDGKQVAYAWFSKDDRYELRVTALSGPVTPRVLFSNADVEWIAPFDWSPDGKVLAVQVSRIDRTSQIGLLSTTDGTLKTLKSIDWRGVSKMMFSPGGEYVAYDLPASDDSDQRDVYVMSVDGSREVPIIVDSSNEIVLAWLSEDQLSFASDRSGAMGAWSISIRDGKRNGVPQLIKADIQPTSMGLTRTGTLYYSVRVSGQDAYIASLDFESGKVLSAPTKIAQRFVGFNDSPEWSPDGKLLAYLSRRDSNVNRGNVLGIRSTETGKVRELKPNLKYFNMPRWSTPSDSVFVSGTDNKGRQGIYRIALENGEATPVVIAEPGAGGVALAAWSPDGRTLYLRRYDAQTKGALLLARDMQSAIERELFRAKGFGRPALSRDGRSLALWSWNQNTKSFKLLIIETATGASRELLSLGAPEALGFVTWTPDGKYIVFNKLHDTDRARRELWCIDVAGGQRRRLQLDGPTGNFASVHPDGHQFAFSMGDPKWEVWAMENFLKPSK